MIIHVTQKDIDVANSIFLHTRKKEDFYSPLALAVSRTAKVMSVEDGSYLSSGMSFIKLTKRASSFSCRWYNERTRLLAKPQSFRFKL